MGWGDWHNQVAPEQPPVEEVPGLIPIPANPVMDANAPGIQPQAQQDAVEEVLQADVPFDEFPAPSIPQHADHVLAMDELTDSSKEEEPMPPLMDDLEVGSLIFLIYRTCKPLMLKRCNWKI